jgi:cytochrome bd-type quinol oxidase subunit 1
LERKKVVKEDALASLTTVVEEVEDACPSNFAVAWDFVVMVMVLIVMLLLLLAAAAEEEEDHY